MLARCVVTARVALAGAVAAVVAAASPARAQQAAEPPAGPPLIVFHAPAGAPASVTGARAVLAAQAQARGTALIDLSPPPPPAPEAGPRLRRAIEAYESFDLERARTDLLAVLDEAGRTGGAGLSASELGDAHIHLALVLTVVRDDPAPAWEHFVRAAVLDPSRRLDPVRYPPRVVETFQRALELVTRTPPATLRVDVDPACEVVLDGRAVHGRDAVQVARGEHYLRVRCAGHAEYGGRVLVAEDTVTVRPALAAQAPPAPADLRALARERGAARVLAAVAVVSPDAAPTLTLALLDAATGKERGRVLASLSEDTPAARAELRRAVERLLDGSLLAPAAAARPGPTPWYRRPWVWGVTGATVGAAVGTAVLLPLVLDRDQSSGFDVHLGGELPR